MFTTTVRNTRSPQTIGDDQLRPGRSVFHATFSVADHLSGKWAFALKPVAPDPRNCGQFASPVAEWDRLGAARHISKGRMMRAFILIVYPVAVMIELN
jgi:hypothetical protein